MKKSDILKYIIPVCFGIILWTPPCYSFGFPSFDIAEVAGTIKGVITSAQSYVSTAQSTISQSKELLALGDGISSIMKFKDEALEKVRKATKEAKKLKNLERLKDLRTKIENGIDRVSDIKNEVTDAVEGAKSTVTNAVDQAKGITNQVTGVVNQAKETTNMVVDIAGQNRNDGLKNNNSKDTTLEKNNTNLSQNITSTTVANKTIENTEIKTTANVGNATNKVVNLNSNSTGRSFTVSESVKTPAVLNKTTNVSTSLNGKTANVNTLNKVEKPVVSPVGSNNKTVSFSASSLKTENTTQALKTSNAVVVPKVDTGSKTISVPKTSAGVRTETTTKPEVLKVETNTSVTLKNPTVNLPNVSVGRELGNTTVNTLPVNNVLPVVSSAKDSAVSKPKINTKPSVSSRMFKTSNLDFNIVSSSSFAQLSSSFKGGTTDDGRFVFSDIFAAKCNLSFEDAENEDKVKECFKTWVLCMNNQDKEEALACREEYKKAMHEQVAADLASSISDKKYASSFDTDVAEDLESKATALTNEREEVSYVGEVNKANQELLLRLMHSMSSRIVKESLLAIEQIDASHYDEE